MEQAMRKIIVQDALTQAERRRIEALKLAIAMEPGRYPDAAAYMADAEAIERWIEDANAPPLPSYAALEADADDDHANRFA
jgi:hypothetical protein